MRCLNFWGRANSWKSATTLAIVCAAALGMLGLVRLSYRIDAQSREVKLATELARQKIDELENWRAFSVPLVEKEDDLYTIYKRLSYVIDDGSKSADANDTYMATVIVSWTNPQGKPQKLSYTSLLSGSGPGF